MRRTNLGEIEIRGNRLYGIYNFGFYKTEVDLTPVWYFFNEVKSYQKKKKNKLSPPHIEQ